MDNVIQNIKDQIKDNEILLFLGHPNFLYCTSRYYAVLSIYIHMHISLTDTISIDDSIEWH